MKTRQLTPFEYPQRIRQLENPPEHLTVAGDIDPGQAKVIAFVGARKAEPDAIKLITNLAAACADQGAIVVSGGALGIDTAAHRGALSVGGRTWSVLGSGIDHVYPEENAELFESIASATGCAVIWPFENEREPLPQNFLARNRILVGLADIVVVGQASFKSGSRNAATVARKTKKELWIVPGMPWQTKFAGSTLEIEQGANTLVSQRQFMVRVFGKNAARKARQLKPIADRTPEEMLLLEAATDRPEHVDELCDLAGLAPHSAATALLTLALEHVLVEGPPGYYRRG